MILKCKMCGGDIVLSEDKTTGTCDHCGSTMTFPRVSDEQKLNLYNRANHFRRQNEFDKAITAYERILDQDDTDAEAHWGAVLSRYGIEYVEDPVTHERIPTCHRVQLSSILSDGDYLAALENAPDTASRDLYEQEARRIAEIQKGILSISSQEKPYDVFICYKETDDSGSRTKDSTLAQEIYYQLTNESYKVFFSRITLEDKLGQQYEPYIFAALNSAKVMLVIGTKPEYFNAVWVKNEWSRYLALMKNDRSRLLIPCYRDMDAYDLPEDLGGFQSQDMGKIGFMQDLIRGVKKVLDVGKQAPTVSTTNAAGPGVSSLHKRAVLFLEDGDWESAKEYLDRILDIDPEYAPAYIGKVQVAYCTRREADLARCKEPIRNNPDYQKALRFADEQQKAIYSGYNRAIEERIELERKEAIYREADALEKRAAVEADFLGAAKKYDEAGSIRDAKERAANCRAKAAAAKAEAERTAEAYRQQMEKERQERARQVEKEKQERARQEEERRQQELLLRRQEEAKREKRKRRNRKLLIAFFVLVFLGVTGYFGNDMFLQPFLRYREAQTLLDQGKYNEAASAFANIANFSDSLTKAKEACYKNAISMLQQGNLNDAWSWFNVAGDYFDAKEQADRIQAYLTAENDYQKGQYLSARSAYASLDDFQDAQKKYEAISKLLYDDAKEKLQSGDYSGAYQVLSQIRDYADSAQIADGIDQAYQDALALWSNGDKTGAENALQAITGWSDATEKLEALREEIADDAFAAGDYETALGYYNQANQTEQVQSKITETKKRIAYTNAQTDFADGDLLSAYNGFVAAGNYQDAAKQAIMIDNYLSATNLLEEKNYAVARIKFKALVPYLDSAEKLEECNQILYAANQKLLESGNIAGAYKGFQSISDYADSAEITTKIESDYQAAQALLEQQEYDKAISAFIALKNYADSETMAVESQYQKACSLQSQGKYEDAIPLFHAIASYRNSSEMENICKYQIAEALLSSQEIDAAITAFEAFDYKDSADRAKSIRYEQAMSLWQAGDLEAAARHLVILGEYKDAAEKLVQVSTALADRALEEKDYATALIAYQRLEQTDEIKAKEYSLAQMCYNEGNYAEATAAYETLGQYELSLSRLPVARYAWADQLFKNGEYEKAAEQFALLGSMTDSAERAKESVYLLAVQKLNNKEYDAAKVLFTSVSDYQDANIQAKECDYRKADDLLASKDYQSAQMIFETLGSYSDSSTKWQQCIYCQAEELFAVKKYAEAKVLYDTISFSDSKAKSNQCVYYQAEALFAAGNYPEAEEMYSSISYQDSQEKAKLSAYSEAAVLYNNQLYAEAEEIFLELKDYSDSEDRAKDSHLLQGRALMDAGDYQGALTFFESVDYADSADLAAECHYALGRVVHMAGNTDGAVAEYAFATSLQEAREALMSAAKDYCAINEIEKAIQTLWLIRDQENAKNMLMEIGALKQQTGKSVLAVLAFAAIGDSDLSELHSLIHAVSFESYREQVKQCSLLSSEKKFTEDVLYCFAEAAFAEGEYDTAIGAFEVLESYKDAQEKTNESWYSKAERLLSEKKYDEAISAFDRIEKFKDAEKQAKEARYQKGLVLLSEKRYDEAANVFSSIKGYGDASTQEKECYYLKGQSAYSAKKYDVAVEAFEKINNYKDSNDMLRKADFYQDIYENSASFQESVKNNPNLQTPVDIEEWIRTCKDAEKIVKDEIGKRFK